VVQVFVAIISLIANTFQHTKMLEEYDISFFTLVMYDLMKTPYLLYSTMPLTIVISTMLVMVTLLKSNELLAYVSLGGQIRRIAIPFVISGAIVAGVLYISADLLVPKVMLAREKYSYKHIKKRTFTVSSKLTDMWLKENDSKFINISLMDPMQKQIYGVTEYNLDDKFQVDSIVKYDSAIFKEDKWIINNIKTFTMTPVPMLQNTQNELKQDRELFDELTSLPTLKPQYLSLKEVRRIASVLRKQNLNAAKYELQLYKHYSHAISVIVIVLVIFPLCIGFSRNHSYMAVASKSLFTGFAYWMMQASLISLGKTGVMSPVFSCFAPIALFMVLAAVLIFRRERAL